MRRAAGSLRRGLARRPVGLAAESLEHGSDAASPTARVVARVEHGEARAGWPRPSARRARAAASGPSAFSAASSSSRFGRSWRAPRAARTRRRSGCARRRARGRRATGAARASMSARAPSARAWLRAMRLSRARRASRCERERRAGAARAVLADVAAVDAERAQPRRSGRASAPNAILTPASPRVGAARSASCSRQESAARTGAPQRLRSHVRHREARAQVELAHAAEPVRRRARSFAPRARRRTRARGPSRPWSPRPAKRPAAQPSRRTRGGRAGARW